MRSDSVVHWKLLVEGMGELQFFQVLVVEARSVEEAVVGVRDYLHRDGCRLVRGDEEETQVVSLGDIPPNWVLASPSQEGLVAASGRIWVKPEDA